MAGAWERPSKEANLDGYFSQGQGKESLMPRETDTLGEQGPAQGHSAASGTGLLTLLHCGEEDEPGQPLRRAFRQ